MTYATQQDLVDRFGEAELAQRTNRTDGLTIDTDVLGLALTDADAEIDSYLATRYALPLASTPAVLVRVAADIARYRLFGDGAPDEVRNRYTDAVKLLMAVADGKVQLGTAALVVAPGGAGNAVAVRTPERMFGAEQLRNY